MYSLFHNLYHLLLNTLSSTFLSLLFSLPLLLGFIPLSWSERERTVSHRTLAMGSFEQHEQREI